DDPVLESAEGDIAAVIGDGRAYPGLDQLLDGGDGFGVLRLVELVRRGGRLAGIGAHQRPARPEMLPYGPQARRLELLPVTVPLGDGDEIGAEEHTGDAVDVEQALRQRRTGGLGAIAHVEGPGRQHRPAGKEFQRRRIGGRLGLNEHDGSPDGGPAAAWFLHRIDGPSVPAGQSAVPCRLAVTTWRRAPRPPALP